MKLLLEDILFEEIDNILYEAFPPIFLELNNTQKSNIIHQFNIGPNSTQKRILMKDINNERYEKGLIIITNQDYIPKLWIANGRFGNIEDAYKYGSNGKIPKNTIDDFERRNNIAFYITPDAENAKVQDIRTERGNINGLEDREQIKKIKDRIIKYIELKRIEFKKELSKSTKKKIKVVMDEWKKKVNDFDINSAKRIKFSGPLHGKGFDAKKDAEDIQMLMNQTKDNLVLKLTIPTQFNEINNYFNKKIEEFEDYLYSFENSLKYGSSKDILDDLNNGSIPRLTRFMKSIKGEE